MATEANLKSGYIVLYRSAFYHRIFTDYPASYWKIFTWMIKEASYTERTVATEYGPLTLEPGSFIASLASMARDTRQSLQTLRTCVSFLKKNEMVTYKSTNKFTVYHVVNYGFYQPSCQTSTRNLTGNQQATNKQLTSRQQATNNIQEDKKERSEEEKTNTCAPDGARELVLTPPEFQPNGRKTKSGPAPCGWKWEAFQMFWAEYWRRTDKKPAWAAYHELIVVPQDAADCKAAMLKARGPMLERDQEKRPMGATWLHRRTWLPEFRDADEIPVEHDLSWAMEEPK